MPERIKKLSEDQAHLDEQLDLVSRSVEHLVEAVEARPTKKTMMWLYGLMIAALILVSTISIVGVAASYNLNQKNADVIEILDPESQEYKDRVTENRQLIIEANNQSNLENYCEVERGLLERFTEPGEELPAPSDRCVEYIERVYGE